MTEEQLRAMFVQYEEAEAAGYRRGLERAATIVLEIWTGRQQFALADLGWLRSLILAERDRAKESG